MEGYVVKYHPEGWMSVKEDGLPDKAGYYIVAVQSNLGLSDVEREMVEDEGYDPDHFFDCVTSAWFDIDAKLWCHNGEYYNAFLSLKDVAKSSVVTYWQEMPTPPWDIFPKES